MNPPYSQVYDYIFIGIGAGNSLLLLEMIKEGLTTGKKIAIIDPNLKNTNDKTYCFWAATEDPILKDLAPLITHRYSTIHVSDCASESIGSQPYCCIRSIDLYNHIHQIIADHSIRFYPHSVLRIESEHTYYTILTGQEIITGTYIFDSRPPVLNNVQKNDLFLSQSFYGLHVALDNEVLDPSAFELMNFLVEQSNSTQFFYILPYSQTEALIEFTRFGTERMDADYGKRILHEFITRHYGSYHMLAEEKGCIPMTTLEVERNNWAGVLHTGARANLIKPSTGYGFKNMYNFAVHAVKHIKSQETPQLNQIKLPRSWRFKFYDHLLLIILYRWPHLGKPIFEALFKKQPIPKVLLFLDEKTTLWNDITLFASLPILPFLKALMVYVSPFLSGRFIFFTFYLATYYTVAEAMPAFVLTAGYAMLIVGMLVVGLPHGSVDHLLIDRNKISLFGFILKYMGIIFAYYLFWQYLPTVAIILFIVYSAFHFGESELEHIGISASSGVQSMLSFLTGLCILLFIIASHPEQTIATLASIHGLEFVSDYRSYLYEIQLLVLIISIGILALLAWQFWKKSLFFLLFVLFAGVKLPLLLAFGSYFIFQHSTNAWVHIKHKLHVSNRSLLKEAYPFTLGAVALFLIFVLFASFYQIENIKLLESHFYIFLACISLPHILVMHTFYKG
jgi:lycopene beta-cyclase